MRPIRLILNAFGPYAGKEVVDFTAALDAGIFGIYGDTGSGKTTIFDGIAFALFGQSSGGERVVDDMRSHYADSGDKTFVELVFDLGEKRYVIRRIPRQERAAIRGKGTTLQAHEAYLFNATGLTLNQITEENLGDVLAEKKTSLVDPMIKALLGYDAAQFRQIVLLPQGDFRKILTASSDERSPILKRLFDVSLYESFVQRIRIQASTMHREIKDERLRKETVLEGVTEDELKEEIASYNKSIVDLKNCVEVLEAEESTHQHILTAAKALIEKFKLLADAKGNDVELKLEAETIKAYMARVTNARAAQLVLPDETAKDRTLQELSDASKQKSSADSTFGDAGTKDEAAKAELDRVVEQQSERDAAAAKVQKLNHWKEVLDKAASLQQPIEAVEKELETALESEVSAKGQALKFSQNLEDIQKLQKAQPDHIKAVSDATARLTKLKQEAEVADRYEASLLKRDQQASNVEVLRDSHQKAGAYLTECKDAFSQAEKELTDIQALHVARKLVTGEPCPACGSYKHPHPATGNPKRLGRHEAFEEAENARTKAQDAEREAKGLLDAGEAILSDRQQELDALVNPERNRETLVPLLMTARRSKEVLERDARFNDLATRLAAAEGAHRIAKKTLEDASLERARKNEITSNAQTALRTTLSEVPKEWRNGVVLAEELLKANAEKNRLEKNQTSAIEAEKDAALVFASALEAKRNAKSNFTRTQKASTDAAEAFSQSLKQSKLNEDGFQAAKSDVGHLGELESAIQIYENKVASNTDRLERLVQEIGKEKQPDLEPLEAAAQTCATQLKTARDDKTRLTTELDRKNKVLMSVTELSDKINELEKKYKPLGEISNLVNGENDLKVRLPDFAIAAMFDEVLNAANLRFGPMTNHRYQLHRPEETTGGRSKRGLDIAVFDANTEKSRSTTSLSGGEGFQASLALALGLSDVVQQNSGGIKLDAIFIDEGFGTLDHETLDTALDTLSSLTGEMRAVGLISHTEQVKALITEGFDIEVTPSGSHIHARNSAA